MPRPGPLTNRQIALRIEAASFAKRRSDGGLLEDEAAIDRAVAEMLRATGRKACRRCECPVAVSGFYRDSRGYRDSYCRPCRLALNADARRRTRATRKGQAVAR